MEDNIENSKNESPQKQKVTLYVPDDLHPQFKIRSAIDGETMSEMAQRAIEFYLSHADLVETTEGNARIHSCPQCDTSVAFGSPQSEQKISLNIDYRKGVSDDLVALEIAELCKALNAYHIACGGTGLAIDDWKFFVRSRQYARV